MLAWPEQALKERVVLGNRDHVKGPFEHCAVPENIHTLPTNQKGLEFPGGRGFCKAKSLKKFEA